MKMKKRIAVLLTGAVTASILLAGCSSNRVETDNVTVAGYKGIEIEDVEEPDEVTDEEVEDYINSVLSQYSTTEQVTDRAVADGDTVNVDFVGTMDGVEFSGGSTEGAGYTMQIGAGLMIEGFEESVIGHMPGETYDWNGNFPDPYTVNPDYSGKAVTFAITVNYILGETTLPELTDEMVQEISTESKTVEEYREEVKKLLEDNAETDYESSLQQAAWDAVIEKAEVKSYPEDEKTKMLDNITQTYQQAAESAGLTLEEYLQQAYGVELEEFEENAEQSVEASLKENMVARAIAEKERLTPSDEELEKAYEEMAQEYGFEDVDAMKEVADEDTLKDMVVLDIVKEWVGENAIQVKE